MLFAVLLLLENEDEEVEDDCRTALKLCMGLIINASENIIAVVSRVIVAVVIIVRRLLRRRISS